MGLDNPIHIAFLLILLLLVFGAKRLPEMGRSLGDGMRGFKDALSGEGTAPAATDTAAAASAQPALAVAQRPPWRPPQRSGAPSRWARSSPQPERRPRAASKREPGLEEQRTDHGSRRRQHRARGPLSVVDHLEELRTRLIVCLAVVAVAFGVLLLAEPRAAEHHQRAARAPDPETGEGRQRPARLDVHRSAERPHGGRRSCRWW